MTVLGVDPGRHGGLAVLASGHVLDCRPMLLAGGEIDPADMATYIQAFAPAVVCIERAQAMPKQGVVSMFNFGTGYGLIIGICAGLGIPCELVLATTWKRDVLAGTAKDKNAAIAYCRRVFPGVSLLPSARSRVSHDGMADALCIAQYATRRFGAPAND